MRRRKYCSVACRQRLHYKLQVRTGLLKALQTRYATFHFDDRVIVLDLLPYGRQEIFSFLFARRPGVAPADDFSRMANVLGSKGVPNRVDSWGPDRDHDWPLWRDMLPRYVDELA